MRADSAADRQADQEHRENDREDVDREAEQHAQQPRPDDFRAQRGGAGEADGDVDRSSAGLPSATGAAARAVALAGGLRYAVPRRGVRAASAKLPSATATLMAAATYVADGHVVNAQQVEAREQASEHRARRVAAVQQAVPGDAVAAWTSASATMAGSDAPIRMVGGNRQMAAEMKPRSSMPGMPCSAPAT